jgi:hypothetical protein
MVFINHRDLYKIAIHGSALKISDRDRPPSFQILHLFTHLLNQHFQLHRRLRRFHAH